MSALWAFVYKPHCFLIKKKKPSSTIQSWWNSDKNPPKPDTTGFIIHVVYWPNPRRCFTVDTETNWKELTSHVKMNRFNFILNTCAFRQAQSSRLSPERQGEPSSGSNQSVCYTIPLHCRDEYTTSSPISSPLSLVSCGEQSNTVFFTLDPSLAIARTSQSGNFSSIGKHRAMKWAWKRSGSSGGKGQQHDNYQ